MNAAVSAILRALMLPGLLALVLLTAGRPALAQPGGQEGVSPDQERLIQELVREITRRVVEELRNGDLLREPIRQGIEDYVREQEAARAAAAVEQARLANERARQVAPPKATRDHIYGSPDAPISLIVYSDFECPYCKLLHSTPKAIVDARTSDVNWVYRHFPLPMHAPGAQRQAEAAECAAELGGNAAFWAYTDAIYARTESGGQGFPLTALGPLAAELGLDAVRFEACLSAERHAARVRADVAEAATLGLNSTPTVIVRNNRTGDVRLRTGALPAEVFTADIDALLAGPN